MNQRFKRASAASVADRRASRVELLPDRVVKHQPPERARAEVERTNAARTIGATTGLFTVPEIISFDATRGQIVFARLPNAVSGRKRLMSDPDPALGASAARALAAIHTAGPPPLSRAEVRWHGDFGFGNLLYSPGQDRPAIIDWSNSWWTDEPAERATGPVSHDLGLAIISIFYARVASPRRIGDPEVIGTSFLGTYGRLTDPGVVGELQAAMPDLCRRWFRNRWRHRGPVPTLAYWPSIWRARRFVHRFRPPTGDG